jgi:hypothetical protein
MELTTDPRTQVETFLSVLFAPTDLVEIRVLPSGRQYWRPAREVPELVNELSFANTQGQQDIYFGANPRMRDGGEETDVALARSLFADWDDCLPENVHQRIGKLPPPTLVLGSGHGTHAYWKLADPLTDLALWRAAQKAIIEKVKSDPKIKDPPRIMRLPGFLNIPDEKKGETEAVPVVITAVNAEAVYHLADIVGEVKAEAPPVRPPAGTLDQNAVLSRSTLQFCFSGAPSGERNARLFNAACDMAGNNFSQADAEAKLLPPAASSGLEEAEALRTIESAYGKPRAPAVPPDSDEVGSAFQKAAAPPPTANGEAAATVGPSPVPVAAVPGGRPIIGNVLDTTNAEGEPLRYHLTLPQIAANIVEATSGWPRRAGGLLFVPNGVAEDLPLSYHLSWLGDVDSFFAWLGKTCDVRWATGDAQHHVSKKKLNPPTKRELYAYLADNAGPVYAGVEFLPHCPPVNDLYYVRCRLPDVPLPDAGATPLQELVLRFNPETPLDRQLMLAALLTPGWGGPPGARPAFIFTSDHGRGVGKTATATVLADVWGGCMTIGAKEDWDQVRKRLLGDDAMAKRILLIDNIKGRMSGGDIEGFITAKDLDGWKPYHGQASRRNMLTWFFTANSPSLSRDLADRAIIIKIGAQRHGEGFIRWAQEFVRVHRPMILAEIFEILKGDGLCGIDSGSRDRWGAWQDGILTRFEEGNELAALAISRRPDVDADLEDAEEIARAVLELVGEHFPDHDTRRIHITYQQLYNRLLKEGVIDKNFGPRNANSWIRDRCASGPLASLTQYRPPTGKRGWLYTGPKAKAVWQVDQIQDGEAASAS